jgi:hypothetical protein
MAGEAAPPGGLRPAVLGVVAVGRVILGHSAVTLVDLAQRDLLQVTEVPGRPASDWALIRATGNGLPELLPFEAAFVSELLGEHGTGSLSQLTSRLEPAVRRFRHHLVHEAVSHGWFRRLHHDQRTPEGDELADRIRAFRVRLRRSKATGGPGALQSQLPYALLFGLLPDSDLPLVRFAQAWVLACSQVPALRPSERGRAAYDEVEFSHDEWRGVGEDLAFTWSMGF